MSPHCVATTNREFRLSGLSGNESLVTYLVSPVSTAINLWGSAARRATIREVHAEEARESKHNRQSSEEITLVSSFIGTDFGFQPVSHFDH